MDDSIVWKEAKSQRCNSASDPDSESEIQVSHEDSGPEQFSQSDEDLDSPDDYNARLSPPVQSTRGFSHHQVNLKLRRNITALADPAQHKPKPEYAVDIQSRQPFDQWLEGALVAISPSADIILFSSQSPEKQVFIAKLRMEPVYQYTTKSVHVPLDYDEQITSLLCIPIMSTQRTALGSIDWTALVVGMSSGYVKFYTEQSICLLSLKFVDEPVISLKLQTQKVNTNARSQAHFASIVDELFITYRTCAIVTDGIGLYENLRISKEDVTKNKSNYEPAYNLMNLPTILTCQKWKFDESSDTRVVDADLLGMRCLTRFDALKSESINSDYIPPKSFTRSLAVVGRSPFITCYREAKDTTAHSYTELIGSLLPFWSKPQPSRVQINEIVCSINLSLSDKGRTANSIVASPDKRLAALTDDFGRVMLVDVTNWLVIRLWKGYRNAQCGWVEVKRNPAEINSPCASFLVIYAPKRGLLEVWSAQRGPRVAAFNVGKSCRLLYAGHRMLNMRAECSSQKVEPSNLLVEQTYSNNCYLLDAKSETIFSIELPYTYSLYKYGDLKSRDRLLINELASAIQQDAEVSSLSEIIQRMALAESLQISIKKIASSSQPDKVVPVLESLINKIMKDYDNHSGDIMSDDDQSIVELSKRVLRLCSMFEELSNSKPCNISLPDVNERLIEQYEDHPREVDDFSEKLGWKPSEILRYLSLLALEQSYRKDSTQDPWPNMGEPLAWSEFVACFDLERINYRSKRRRLSNSGAAQHRNSDKIALKLRETTAKFLREDKVVKTSVFLYNRLSESFYHKSANTSEINNEDEKANTIYKCLTHLEPASRLMLLFQFWLSTRLCNYWKMWAFLQRQVGVISDELRVIVMTRENDELLIESWKKIYQLILESDNIYAAMIATAAIRSDTLRMISDNEKREKLERDDDQGSSSVDWECLCVDAERISLFSQQLEDIFLLGLLLKYSPEESRLVDRFVYRVPRISVANIFRGGPSVVSELIAQWVVQAEVDPKIFTQPYGIPNVEDQEISRLGQREARPRTFSVKQSTESAHEHTKELLHHIKISFPQSLEPDVLLLNCVWEFCNRWANGGTTTTEKTRLLDQAYSCLSLLSDTSLKHNSAGWVYKTFFQRTFERLTILVETNATILSPKCTRSRDVLVRRELNLSESCLEDFVLFCFKLSDFMLSTCNKVTDAYEENELDGENAAHKLSQRLFSTDDWWSTPLVVSMMNSSKRALQSDRHAVKNDIYEDDDHENSGLHSMEYQAASVADVNNTNEIRNTLLQASLSRTKLFDVNELVELNRLTTLMVLIFKLKIIKTYPLSLIGEESRQTLKLDLQQSPSAGADMKTRSGLLSDLRQKFARKCVVSIVTKISDESSGFDSINDEADDVGDGNQINLAEAEDVDTDRGQLPTPPSKLGDGGRPKIKVQPASHYAHASFSTSSRQQTEAGSSMSLTRGETDVQIKPTSSTKQSETNESMSLFTHLLSLACDWQLDYDELHLELAFELYRCNHDKLAAMIATRIRDKQTFANGLLKIASQRVLAMFGLSPQLSTDDQWRKRVDKWSLFHPNVVSWLRGIQEEEARGHELAKLQFPESSQQIQPRGRTVDLDVDDFDFYIEQSLGLRLFALKTLQERTKCALETVTNYLEGQANRLAYDLLELLESGAFDRFLAQEKKLWSLQRNKAISSQVS